MSFYAQITPFYRHGDLYDTIEACQKHTSTLQNAPDIIRRAIFGACQGLHWMHCMGVVHRDVSPENIFLGDDDGLGVIADCGMALDYWVHAPATATATATGSGSGIAGSASECRAGAGAGAGAGYTSGARVDAETPASLQGMHHSAGKPYYGAPELRQGKLHNKSIDVYSIGISMFWMLCFGSRSSDTFAQVHGPLPGVVITEEYMHKQMKAFMAWHCVPETAQDLVLGMARHDPSHRLPLSDVLSHSYFEPELRRLPKSPTCEAVRITLQLQEAEAAKTHALVHEWAKQAVRTGELVHMGEHRF